MARKAPIITVMQALSDFEPDIEATETPVPKTKAKHQAK
jgi:hypothetical protein